MLRPTLLTGAFLLACTSAFAADDEGLSTIESIAAFATGPCMIHQSGDIDATLKVAKKLTLATGLPLLMEQDRSMVFGDFAGLNVTISGSIDSASCAMRIPGAMINHAGFEAIEAAIQAVINARYPDHLEALNDDPSPHVDGHDWVIRTEANDSLAITIQFGTETGVLFVSAANQQYD